MPKQFVKTTGRDAQKPDTFFWSIQKLHPEKNIVLLERRGIATEKEALEDLRATLAALGSDDIVTM